MAVSGGENVLTNLSYALPLNIPAADYYFILQLDDGPNGGVIAESSDLNNVKVSTVKFTARQADLAAMGMAAQQDIEAGSGGLPIHFRRVREQNGKLVVGYCGSSLLNVLHSVEMGVTNAAEMDALAAALNNDALVEQHPNSHRL